MLAPMERWRAELVDAVGARIVRAEPVSGGDINDAYRVQLDDGRSCFVKTHARPPEGMYAAEAAGLEWLRAGPVRVPHVIAVGASFLALEWLELSNKGPRFDMTFGRELARLHAIGAPGFGLERDNFLATIPQSNAPLESDGPTFWVERRLRPMCERAHAMGRMPDLRDRLDRLLAARDRFGPDEPPARLHGDLWWGNVVAVDGAPAIIDPAVYGGHREVDLAMLSLFGGVSSMLLGAYQELRPLATGWQDRVGLWQLYPLAAHAVLFGGGYGAQVVRGLDALL